MPAVSGDYRLIGNFPRARYEAERLEREVASKSEVML